MQIPYSEYDPISMLKQLAKEIEDPTDALVKLFMETEEINLSGKIKSQFSHDKACVYLLYNPRISIDSPVYAGYVIPHVRNGGHNISIRSSTDRISARLRAHKTKLSVRTYPDGQNRTLVSDTHAKVIVVGASQAPGYENCLIKHFGPVWNNTGFGCEYKTAFEKSSWAQKYPRAVVVECQQFQNTQFLLQ